MSFNKVQISNCISIANTGADAIKRAPIVEEDTGIKCIRIGDISNDKSFDEWGFTSANDNVVSKFGLKKDDILIARTGNTIGVVKYIDRDLNSVYNNGLIRLRVDNEKYYSKYIYYNLISNDFKSFINSISAGTSTQPNMKINDMLRYSILDINLEEQKAIAKILADLDNKIEVNNKINKRLEEMAQSIFKHWFVDFEFPNEEGNPYKSSGGEMVESELGIIPKGWEVKKLEDIANLTMGVSPTSDSYNDKGEGLPLINGASDFKGKNIEATKNTTSPKKICKVGDLVFGVRATIGNTVFSDGTYAIGRGVASVHALNRIDKEILYLNLENSMAKLIQNASGSVFLNLKKSDISEIKIVYNDTIVKKSHNVLCPIIKKIIKNDKETSKLKELRDTLLPKLMSGEIRVPLD